MNAKQRTANQLKATAYHEAAHALAAFQFDIRVKRVTIIPDADSLGHCLSQMPKSFNPELDLSATNKLRLEHRIIGLYVGAIAERRFTGRANRVGARSDRAHA